MRFDAQPGTIDVYPVGVLADLRRSYRALRRCVPQRLVWSPLRHAARAVARHARARDWRALKSTFNGYLAEPTDWPDGLRRCGSGWTEARALRDLNRRVARLGR